MRRREGPSNTGNEGGRRIKHRATHGASSSRTQQPLEPEPNVHLQFGYLFGNNEAEHAQFMVNLGTRPIIKPMSLDMTFFTNEGFEIMAMLGTSHLTGLAEMTCPYSEVMVRAFYHNLSYINGDLQSRVCGVKIQMTAPIWTVLLGFDFDARGGYKYDGDKNVAIKKFNQDEAMREARRPGGHRPKVTGSQLTVSSRILFYVMTHILFPRASNHSRVFEGDIFVMWAIRHGIQVNWRHYICMMMKKAKEKNTAALPYAYLVQKILKHFRVPMHNAQMVSQNKWNVRFGQRLLKQCKISKVANGVWKYIGVEEDVPDASSVPPIVLPEVHDDDDDADVHMEDFVEPDGGFSFRDVMQAINASMKQMSMMEAKQGKRWKSHIDKENERWRWMQGRIKGLEDRLGQLQLGREQEAAGDDDLGAGVSDEDEKDLETSEDED